MQSDIRTICAPVHKAGSAITIIRVSGRDAIAICEKIFRPKRQGKIGTRKGFSLIFGEVVSGTTVIDEVLLSLFLSPHSYTGEDMVEIACHGSAYIQSTILQLLIMYGASPARAGEFTQRAFLNGKIDLSQAEAVADLIASESEAAHRLAMNQLKGGFSKEILLLRAELLDLVSLLELELDFGEEDVEFADRKQLLGIAESILDYTVRLSASFSLGNAVKKGIPVAITGRPNVGKSTLLNGLLNEERAIVSEIPGTTRDAIEDTFTIDGVLYRFIDTAGLRQTDDIIENLGIQKTRDKISKATAVIFMTEATLSAEVINEEIVNFRKTILPDNVSLIVVVNKTDKVRGSTLGVLKESVIERPGMKVLFMSAAEATGYSVLKSALTDITGVISINDNMVVITNARHYEALLRISESIERVLEGIENNTPSDLIALDTRQAIHYLGEISGEISSDEILGNIFKNFCIGK
jgi:tRNA modification GTPase